MHVSVMHRISDAEGFDNAEQEALEAGLPDDFRLPVHAATRDHTTAICIWQGPSSMRSATWSSRSSVSTARTSTTRWSLIRAPRRRPAPDPALRPAYRVSLNPPRLPAAESRPGVVLRGEQRNGVGQAGCLDLLGHRPLPLRDDGEIPARAVRPLLRARQDPGSERVEQATSQRSTNTPDARCIRATRLPSCTTASTFSSPRATTTQTSSTCASGSRSPTCALRSRNARLS